LEEGIKYRDDLEVNVRAEIFVQNVVNALDVCIRLHQRKSLKFQRMGREKMVFG